VLNSPRAVGMGIYVVRAFVQLRELLSSNRELAPAPRSARSTHREEARHP
jgi:hypothetical protein